MSDEPITSEPAPAPAPAPEPAPAPAPAPEPVAEYASPLETVTPPAPITIDDIVNSIDYIKIKEAGDKVILETIGNMSADTLKSQLVLWGTAGFPNAYVILKVTVEPPATCSDGVSRNLADYIQFCSGKTITEHVQLVQDKVSGIVVSFANYTSYIGIVVSKP
jgi:hypothetical protein